MVGMEEGMVMQDLDGPWAEEGTEGLQAVDMWCIQVKDMEGILMEVMEGILVEVMVGVLMVAVAEEVEATEWALAELKCLLPAQ
jgi:hypothetical protein